MRFSNIYNFRNTVRHFINVDDLDYPQDITSFDVERELCWTKPISFRIYKADDSYRTIKIPNVLNFIRAYHYYKGLADFTTITNLDLQHKRLSVNLDTGDFVSGNYNNQLNDDFIKLCNYDALVKLDISEYYGRIYTHYLDLETIGLKDTPLAWLNNGRTSGILMGNYISLYFAEYLTSLISRELQDYIAADSIDCFFNYFSDDFYFFCNANDIEKIISLFDKVLAEFDFVRKDKREIWDYESYNAYNMLTRYWKATIRAWNLEVLKDHERQENHPDDSIKHKYTFLNQIVYRLSRLQDEKSKRSFVTNFFKTNHFQSCNYSDYIIQPYDLHQWFFLIKCAPESLLYIAHIISGISKIKNDKSTKDFFKARYKEALKNVLHDEQLYYFYALKKMNYEDVIQETADLVVSSQNQVLISFYLKDALFSKDQIDSLKLLDKEEYWFQSYHLILYSSELRNDMQASITKYLIPKKLISSPNVNRERRYMDFYSTNLRNGKSMINDIDIVTENIKDYLNLRHSETVVDFDE